MTTELLYTIQKPKILLINFNKADEDAIRAKNYNVERGWATDGAHHFPSPGYEYDIIIARFDKKGFDDARKISQYGVSDDDDYTKLNQKLEGAGFALVFTEDGLDTYSLIPAGVSDIKLVDLDERDKHYEISTNVAPALPGYQFSVGILKRVSPDLVTPISKGLEWKSSVYEPKFSLLDNALEKSVSAIGYHKKDVWNPETGRHSDASYTIRYVILPPLKKGYARVVIDFLSQLPTWRTDLFPTDGSYSWLDEEKYSSARIVGSLNEIEKQKDLMEKEIEKLEEAHLKEKQKDYVIQQLLICDDGDEFDEGKKLTDVVKYSLEYLGFSVQNTEKDTTKTGKRREDLTCKDAEDEYASVIECKGTVNSNPPESYVSQLLNHMVIGKAEKGILVVNHDRKRDAFSRSLPYEDAKHLWEDSENITILSTVELFKLIRKVENGEITKEKARLIIKTPGRVEL